MRYFMNEERNEISITIINDGEQYSVKTYLNQYRNLMVLLNNSIYLENFGECGGHGRCATCMVKVVGLKGTANTMERNEAATIGKAGLLDTSTRLSCQLLINADLDGAMIMIQGEG
ncbi:MAG: 2Fe-2S iron-sulfur cluster-binding protein [Chitinophagaceae bacterium]|nr:2Fe-2S iron-sulfur cluster-binding protein [Candidatus Brachybacter algidus]HQW42588.1 2Fe-2S iron-sulfur cluster-binding protein [Chitinophagaceae bacterium]